MGMDRAAEILGAAAVFHVRDNLADELTGPVTENLGAENLVGLRIGDDLHIAVNGVVGDGAPVGGEIELAHGDSPARRLGRILAQADAGDLGFRVDNSGDQIPVYMA